MQNAFFDQWHKPNDVPLLMLKETVLLNRKWGFVLAISAVYLLLGVVAFLLPIISTVGLTLGLAALLLLGGVVRLIHAVQLGHRRGDAARFFQALLSVLAGVLIFRYPGAGMLGIAIALSFYFFVGAAAQWVLSSATNARYERNWGIVSSIASFLLGAFILMTFPFSALWVPGTLLGIDLVFSGIAMMGFSFSLRNAQRSFETGYKRDQRQEDTMRHAA